MKNKSHNLNGLGLCYFHKKLTKRLTENIWNLMCLLNKADFSQLPCAVSLFPYMLLCKILDKTEDRVIKKACKLMSSHSVPSYFIYKCIH